MNLLLLVPALLRISEIVCAGLWRASWQGAVAVLVIAALCRFFPQIPANTRCWLWRLALVKFVLTLLLPAALPLRVLPTAAPATRHLSIAPRSAPTAESTKIVLPVPSANAGAPALPAASEQNVPAPSRQAPPTAHEARFVAQASFGKPISDAAISRSIAVPELVPPLAVLLGCLFSLYLAGVAVCLVRLMRNVRQTARLLRNCRPCGDARTIEDLATLTGRVGWRRPLRLVEASGIASSQLAAGFPPFVVLPSGTTDPEARRLMLAHEIAHLRRHDLPWATFSALTHTLFFFHPAVWWARREEELAREVACDALAVTATHMSPARYGALLVEIVTQGRSGGVSAFRAATSLGIADGVAQIGRRLVALQTIGRPISPRRLRLLLGVSTAASLFAIFPYRFVAAQNARQLHPLVPVTALMAAGVNDSASVTGRLVYGKSKVPCTQADVHLRYLPDEPSSTGTGSWQAYAHADADGRFQFRNVLPGRYRVLTRADYGAWAPLSSVQSSVVTLKAQEHRVLPDIALEEQVQVIGRIVDARTGQPVTDVAAAGGSADHDGQIAADSDWQPVDSDGQYTAYVPAGKSAIYLQRRMYQSHTYTGRKWTSEYALPESARIVKTVCNARQGQALRLDIKVAAVRVSAAAPVLPPVKGKVIDMEGRAVGGAQVFLFAAKYWGSIAPVARTDAQGGFNIANLDPKWADEGMTLRVRHIERGLMSHPVSLTLPRSGATPPITVPLVAHLAGSVEGRVMDMAGRPMPFVAVDLYSGGSYAVINDHAVTDSDGRCQFTGLWPDLTVSFTPTKTGYGFGPVPLDGGFQSFQISSDRKRQLQSIVLYPGDRSVAGRMTHKDGRPLVNVGVSATRGDGTFSHTETDEQGRFRINHLSAGPLRLYFERGVSPFVEAKAGDTRLHIVAD